MDANSKPVSNSAVWNLDIADELDRRAEETHCWVGTRRELPRWDGSHGGLRCGHGLRHGRRRRVQSGGLDQRSGDGGHGVGHRGARGCAARARPPPPRTRRPRCELILPRSRPARHERRGADARRRRGHVHGPRRRVRIHRAEDGDRRAGHQRAHPRGRRVARQIAREVQSRDGR